MGRKTFESEKFYSKIVISQNLHSRFHWLARRTMSLHLIFKISCLTLLKEKLRTLNLIKITHISSKAFGHIQKLEFARDDDDIVHFRSDCLPEMKKNL